MTGFIIVWVSLILAVAGVVAFSNWKCGYNRRKSGLPERRSFWTRC